MAARLPRLSATAGYRLVVMLAVGVLALAGCVRGTSVAQGSELIRGPLRYLLASSTDLGPSRSADAQATVTLSDSTRPAGLIEWADSRGLSVRWRSGDQWAVVEANSVTS